MKLIFELGVEGRGMTLMPECDVPEYQLPEERSEALHLPHVICHLKLLRSNDGRMFQTILRCIIENQIIAYQIEEDIR